MLPQVTHSPFFKAFNLGAHSRAPLGIDVNTPCHCQNTIIGRTEIQFLASLLKSLDLVISKLRLHKLSSIPTRNTKLTSFSQELFTRRTFSVAQILCFVHNDNKRVLLVTILNTVVPNVPQQEFCQQQLSRPIKAVKLHNIYHTTAVSDFTPVKLFIFGKGFQIQERLDFAKNSLSLLLANIIQLCLPNKRKTSYRYDASGRS